MKILKLILLVSIFAFGCKEKKHPNKKQTTTKIQKTHKESFVKNRDTIVTINKDKRKTKKENINKRNNPLTTQPPDYPSDEWIRNSEIKRLNNLRVRDSLKSATKLIDSLNL